VALVEDGCVREEVIFPPSREHLENLAVAVKDLMERQGVTLADLGGIGVATGPGSFSGIRVGLSLAKGNPGCRSVHAGDPGMAGT
jgi:tRNA threonylcarbamoyladenosine biosynthesis protein TsaB